MTAPLPRQPTESAAHWVGHARIAFSSDRGGMLQPGRQGATLRRSRVAGNDQISFCTQHNPR